MALLLADRVLDAHQMWPSTASRHEKLASRHILLPGVGNKNKHVTIQAVHQPLTPNLNVEQCRCVHERKYWINKQTFLHPSCITNFNIELGGEGVVII